MTDPFEAMKILDMRLERSLNLLIESDHQGQHHNCMLCDLYNFTNAILERTRKEREAS